MIVAALDALGVLLAAIVSLLSSAGAAAMVAVTSGVITARITIVAAALSVSLTLAAALVTALDILLVSLSSYLTPPAWLLPAFGFMAPIHWNLYLTVIIGVRLNVAVYRFARCVVCIINEGFIL